MIEARGRAKENCIFQRCKEKSVKENCEISFCSQAWMSEEDELLNRTLQRCLREVRRALDADSDVKALAACKAGRDLFVLPRV